MRTWRRSLGLIAVALVTALGAAAAARLCFLVWPWIPWLVFVMTSCLGAVAGWALGAFVLARSTGKAAESSPWHGVPARVVSMDRDGWTLHIASRSLLTCLDQVVVDTPAQREVRESDATLPGLATLFAVVWVGAVLWFAWHPAVRVVNVTGSAMQVSVDGRHVALLAGMRREAPNAGTDLRLPEGRRVLRAMGLDGEVVDETVGWVGRGQAQLYAPGSEGRCFRLEQRAYGRAAQPRPAIVELPADRSLQTLPVAVDAWFQPNPPWQPDLWFSGGVRRAVRLGECAEGQPASSEEGQR